MPSYFTAKQHRQYEDIKESELDRGVNAEDAKRIAASTVNKRRQVERILPGVRAQSRGLSNKRKAKIDKKFDAAFGYGPAFLLLAGISISLIMASKKRA